MVSASVEILNRLRKMVENLGDFRLSARIRAIIACVSKDRVDIVSALDKIYNHAGHGEALAIIVKVLAEAGRFDEARSITGNKKLGIAGGMAGRESYWHAEACIALAEFSRKQDDIDEARRVTGNIHSPELRNQARTDLELALKNPRQAKSFNPDLFELAGVVASLNAFSDSHVINPKLNSGHLHAWANSIIDAISACVLK